MRTQAIAFCGVLLLAAPSSAQSLIRDINLTPPPALRSSRTSEVFVGQRGGWFAAFRSEVGYELWLTDGTVAGTRLVVDLQPGYPGTGPSRFAELPNGDVVFVATTEQHGGELWRSDGTAAGTSLVADVRPGPVRSGIESMTAIGNLVVFLADDGIGGTELWSSDGTAAGTRRIDLVPGTAGVESARIAALDGNRVIVTGAHGTGWTVWVSDGTAAGTSSVVSVTGFSAPDNLASLGGRVVFRGHQSTQGIEPWVTDGTPAGTTMLADLNPGPWSSLPATGTTCYADPGLYVDRGVAWFLATTTSTTTLSLVRTDGTAAGTAVVTTVAPGEVPFVIGSLRGGDVVYAVLGPTEPHTQDLYRTDGTPSGTSLIRSIGQADDCSMFRGALFNGRLYFTGFGAGGKELWRTNGTAAGTRQIQNIMPGPEGSHPFGYTVLNNRLLFSARDDVVERELWTSDGTRNGAVPINIEPDPASDGSSPELLCVLGDEAYFTADDGASRTLWVTDGTPAGTRRAPGNMPFYTAVGPRIASTGEFFALATGDAATGLEVWVSDGTAAGTMLLFDFFPGNRGSNPGHFVAFGDRILFTVLSELWITDGTRAGTHRIHNAGFAPRDMFVWNDRVFFTAIDNALGGELFVTDGTSAGTHIVRDIFAGASSGVRGSLRLYDPPFVGLGDHVYFAANSGPENMELWRSDGTASGTTLVHDINTASFGASEPDGFVRLGDRIVFVASDRAGLALWSTDGSSAGLRRLASLPRAPAAPLMQIRDDLAVLALDDGVFGRDAELWVTDGTVAGTGRRALVPEDLNGRLWDTWSRPGRSRLLLSADDGVLGRELVVTDGTVAGTRLVADLALGSSSPGRSLRLGSLVLFPADDGVVGSELFGIDLTRIGDWAGEEYGFGCAGSSGATPRLAVSGEVRAASPRPFDVVVERTAAGSAGALLIGFDRIDVVLDGACHLWTQPVVSALASTNAAGRGVVTLPQDPGLVGLRLDFQFATVDIGGALFGQFNTTGGYEIVGGH